MKCFSFFVVLLSLSYVQGDTVNLNQLIDEVLASANQIITAAGKTNVPVNGCGSSWHKKWHFVSVTAKLNCDNGNVGSLNTLKRTGEATMTTNGNTVTINANVGLGDLNFHFDTCRVKISHIFSTHSEVSGTIDSESISFSISLTYDQNKKCSATLNHISLDSIGKIKLKTGGGAFHKVLDKLLDAITNHFRGAGKDAVNKRLTPLAQQAVAKNSVKLCQNIPHSSLL